MRTEVVGQLRAQELAAHYPGSVVLRDVKVWQEDVITVEQFRTASEADKQGRSRHTGADGRERIYKEITDVDALVVDKPLAIGQKATMMRLEQEKTGERDTPANADTQNDQAMRAVLAHLHGGPKVMLLLGKTDITDQLDLTSAVSASKVSIGPAGKRFKESLGITDSDLKRLIKELVADAKERS